MSQIRRSIQVQVPVRTAYDQWSLFEQLPLFMEGILEVRQRDNGCLHWKARIARQMLEWDAEVLQQVPDHIIRWRSIGGAHSEGLVAFRAVDSDCCKVTVEMDVDPRSFAERVGTALGLVGSRVQRDLERFKAFIENRRQPAGPWPDEPPPRELSLREEPSPWAEAGY